MQNQYLEKIAGWANYVGPGGAKRYVRKLQDVGVSGLNDHLINKMYHDLPLHKAELNMLKSTSPDLHSVYKDRRIASNVNLGLLSTPGAVASGVYVYKNSKKDKVN